MLSQIRWHEANAGINPLASLNVVRRVARWWNGRQMNRYIGNELDKRYNEYKTDPENKQTKAVIDLIMQAYLPNNAQAVPERLDAEFRAFAISQIRLFVFVGHDSISSTICYIVYLLAKNPQALARIRAEHDELLGTDLTAVPTLLKEHPHLTNSLPYTTAVIKETLRLFPPGGCARAGKPHVDLVDDQGHICPTEHAFLLTVHPELHRAPAYWIRPDEFLPERWLAEPGHELYPMKGAYRPFEVGPRNCFAQGYTMTELRVALACMMRQFDFTPAYDEWDRMHPIKGLRTYRGERVYQIDQGSRHPADHYPCRVSFREK
jgi:cytochrome P450